MKNILLTLSYDGKNYHGWQVQENAITVQEVFQNALIRAIDEPVSIKGCSRTDSKVHANMYCVNFKSNTNIPLNKMPIIINKCLPSDISVKKCQEVDMDFLARYSCLGKEYIYKIWNNEIRNPFLAGYAFHYWYRLDVDLLNEAAQKFIGAHDFTSFCTLDKRETKNMVRNIKKFEITRDNDLVTMKVEADGFLYNMVRIMVGTLLQVAKGRFKVNDISDIISAKDRSFAGPTAIPDGLYLNKVFY